MAKDLHISPKEALELPISLVTELMCVHQEIESFKLSEMEDMQKKVK
jgi:hypothetical protein|tara:strand:- start:543 stop:683 length:141 start_codon:yes stop_codon:yes gene_type:complete